MRIVADIGGTKMRLAGSRDLASFGEPIILPTPQSYEEALKEFVETARKLAGGEPIEAVAAGFPGVLSRDKRTVERSEHLPQWNGRELASDLETELGGSVRLENDTALVGLGEAAHGAGKGAGIVAYLTVSTGVNGARMVNGAIDPSAFGFEVGAQYLAHEGELVSFEELVSGASIEKTYGKHPKDLGADWQGWDRLAYYAAIGVHNVIAHWSPERVVLGGSMFNPIGIQADAVRLHLEKIMRKFPQLPEIVHSSLHDEGGLYGALALLHSA